MHLAELVAPPDGEGPIAWHPSRGGLAVSDDDREIDRPESIGRRDRHGQVTSTDLETALQGAHLQDGGRHPTGQQESAADLQWAGAGYDVEEDELDGVLIDANRVWFGLILPPEHQTSAGGSAEQEGENGHGRLSPPHGDPLEQRRSRGANLEPLFRLLRTTIVGILHMQSLSTASLAWQPTPTHRPSPAQFAQSPVADAEVVADLVNHRFSNLLHDLLVAA